MVSLVVISGMQPLYAGQRQTPAQQRAAIEAANAKAEAERKAAEEKAKADAAAAAKATAEREAAEKAEADKKAAEEKAALEAKRQQMLSASVAQFKEYLDEVFRDLDTKLASLPTMGVGSSQAPKSETEIRADFAKKIIDETGSMVGGVSAAQNRKVHAAFKYFVEQWRDKKIKVDGTSL